MTSWPFRLRHRLAGLAAPVGRQSTVVAVVALGMFVLVGTAVVIARGDATEAIAEDARLLTWSESVGAAAAVLRGEVREGLVIGQSVAVGVFDQQASNDAAARILEAADELERRAEVLVGMTRDPIVREAAATTASSARDVAAAIDNGSNQEALAISGTDLAGALETLTSRTTEISEVSADHIVAVNAGLGTITTAARFVSALLIPMLAVFLLYRAMRRSQKISLLRSELAREQELRHKKDAFLAAASHHIRTPLSAVVGFSELLRDRTRDFSAGVRNEVIELLAIEADETANVVDDLLAAARYDLGELELSEVELEVRDILDVATSDWAAKQRMRLTITGNAVIVGDARWLTHAIRNLLRNAAAFGGEHIRVDILNVMNRVVIEIADDGEPIPRSEHDRIFELYYSYRQIEGLAPSLGLGLSVARRIARAMGGDLDYYQGDEENVFEMTLRGSASRASDETLPARVIDPNQGAPTLESISGVIAAGGPEIVYQPIIDLEARARGEHRVVGYEGLARFGSQSPPEWFDAASRLGLRLDLELACISRAIEDFDPPEGHALLAVNLTDRTLHTSLLGDAIKGIEPTRLMLELSETASIKSYEETRLVIDALAARGVRMAVDDVGASDVDLWHMIRLGAHMIKIDMSLVRDLRDSPRNRALIKAIVAMTGELGTILVAEGVETEEEHIALRELGVEYGQGYLYGRPSAMGEVPGWLADSEPASRAG